jgi:hypothetical protein
MAAMTSRENQENNNLTVNYPRKTLTFFLTDWFSIDKVFSGSLYFYPSVINTVAFCTVALDITKRTIRVTAWL